MIQLDTTQILLVVAILLAAYLCYLKKSKENFRQSDAVTTLMAGRKAVEGFRHRRRQTAAPLSVRPAEKFRQLGMAGSPSGSAVAPVGVVFDQSKSFEGFKQTMKKPAAAMKNGMGLSGEFMQAAGRKMSGLPAEGFSYY